MTTLNLLLPLLLLHLLLACSPLAVAQQCSEADTKIKFKVPGDPGTPSYISKDESANETVNVLSYPTPMRLPPVVVEVFYKDNFLGVEVPDLSLDGKTVDVEITPQLRLSGNSVEINQGEAIFTALLIQEQNEPGSEYQLTFRVNDPAHDLKLVTGKLNFVDSSVAAQDDVQSIRFGNYGFFFRTELTNKVIPVGVRIPKFFVEGLNLLGHRSAKQFNLEVSVPPADGSITPTSRTSSSGRVEFSDLVYTMPSGKDDSFQVKFTFTAKHPSTGAVVGQIITKGMQPEPNPRSDQFMLFNPETSFFAYDNIGNTAVMKFKMPTIAIQLYTSRMQPDRSNTGLVITAHTEQGTLSGAEALVVRGEALFKDLAFINIAPRSAVITFKAKGNSLVSSQVLYSGAVQVAETSIKAKHLSFAKTSFIQASKDVTVKFDVTSEEFIIPSIIVQVKDSAYQIDSTANGITLQLVVSNTANAVVPTPSAATVVNGIAAFTNVKFTGLKSPTTLRLTIVDQENIRESLSSGDIKLSLGNDQFSNCKISGSDCKVRIQFADSSVSYISGEEQQMFATVDGKIPDIRINLLNEFGERIEDLTNPPQLIAHTGTLGQTEELLEEGSDGHIGVWRKGEYVFGCLIFNQKPTGLVRIKFQLMDGAVPYAGIAPLQTGFVTTTEDPTPNFGLRFAQEGSLVTYVGQTSSAVVNIALPTITIEMVDSLHQFDNSNSDVVIVASTTSGELDPDGSREVMTKGKVSFSTLKFTAVGDEPVLRFTALQSTLQPVAGKSIATGILTVTTLPIRSFEIVFSPVINNDNEITHQYQSLNVDPKQAISASILIRDSAHQVEPLATDRVKIELISRATEFSTSGATKGLTGLSIERSAGAASSFNFTNAIDNFREVDSSGAPFPNAYFTYKVTESDNPLLTGKSLTIGPIYLSTVDTKECSNQLEQPTAVAEFRMTVDDFEAQENEVRQRIAYMMGVEISRVLLANPRATTIVDHNTLERFTGVKVDVTFDKVQPGSTNRKTSSQLNAEFLALRPTCEDSGLCLTAVYPKSKDLGCKIEQFRQARNVSEICTKTSAQCQCYADNIFDTANGQVCAQDSFLEDEVYDICRQLATCRIPSIQSVCDKILVAKSVKVVWLWATLGSVGGVVIILLLLRQRGVLSGKNKASLHNTVDTQY